MKTGSMCDTAYELIGKKKKPVAFAKLWQEVSEIMGFSESEASKKIASFYSNLMLDTRFARLEENKWDLRSRRTYDETHFDTSKLVIDTDEVEEEVILDDEGNVVDVNVVKDVESFQS